MEAGARSSKNIINLNVYTGTRISHNNIEAYKLNTKLYSPFAGLKLGSMIFGNFFVTTINSLSVMALASLEVA